MDLTGGCLCGAVRYRSTGAPYLKFLCHCDDCRKAGGSAFHAGIAVPKADFALTQGALRAYEAKGDAGRNVRRNFCPTCGSGIMNEAEVWPDHVVIRIGTLDEPALVSPDKEFYAAKKLDWLTIGTAKA